MLISDSIFVTFLTITRKVERWVDVGANFPKKEYLKYEKKYEKKKECVRYKNGSSQADYDK